MENISAQVIFSILTFLNLKPIFQFQPLDPSKLFDKEHGSSFEQAVADDHKKRWGIPRFFYGENTEGKSVVLYEWHHKEARLGSVAAGCMERRHN